MNGPPSQSCARAIVVLALLSLPSCSRLAHRADLEAGEAAARSWLGLLDQGQYDKCWSEASSRFRKREARDSWISSTADLKRRLGTVASRRTAERRFFSRLGQGPEGKYVNIVFQIEDPSGRSNGEIMTIELDTDNAWRVYGYKVVGPGAR